MIEYSDVYRLEIWNRLYPVGHPWHKTHGGLIENNIFNKEQLKKEILHHIDNEECVGIHVSRLTTQEKNYITNFGGSLKIEKN